MAWTPTPKTAISRSNPYKWYKINKVTTLKNIPVTSFYICIYQYYIPYVEFEVPYTAYNAPYEDENGNVITDEVGHIVYPDQMSPFKAVVSFRLYYDQASYMLDPVGNKIDDFTHDFKTLPFAVEDGEIGVSTVINEFLANKYSVELTDIEE